MEDITQRTQQDSWTPVQQEGVLTEAAHYLADLQPTPRELPQAPPAPIQAVIRPGWGRRVSEARPAWIAQLPVVHALAPWGRMRLARVFRTLPEHPDSDRLDAAFADWGRRSGLYDDAPPEALAATRMGHLVHWCAPLTSDPVRWSIGTYLLWMIAIDDYHVETGLPLTDLKRACNDVIHSGGSTLPLTPGSRYFIELRHDMRALGGEALYTQIADDVQILFLSNEKEQRYIADDTLPSLSGYLQRRARNGGVNGPILVQRCEQGLLPPHRYFCERLTWIGDLATILAALDNDIVGYQRDIEANYPINIIAVLSLEFHVDLATAYLMALDLIELLMRTMDALVEDVVAHPGDYPEAATQARALAVWPHGWHTWHETSPRYNAGRAPTADPGEVAERVAAAAADLMPPPDQDWRSGLLMRALTGMERWPAADAPPGEGWWGSPLQKLVGTLLGWLPTPSPGAITAPTSSHATNSERVPDADTPPNFPPGIDVRREPYRNWGRTIEVDAVWVCEPRSTDEVALLANWARSQGFQLRPVGQEHAFTPLTLTDGADASKVVLVDIRRHLNALHMVSVDPAAVRAGGGASMETLLGYLEEQGYGLATAPVNGDITLGGVLATGSHGTSVEVLGQPAPFGHDHGLLSNLVVSFTAVVWDQSSGQYIARTFERSHPDSAAFLVNLGRAFLTEITLRVGANRVLRCVSDVSISATELFGPEGVYSTQRFASMVHRLGRVEAIWFPFHDRTWVKTWTPAGGPSCARPVTAPYNYPFADNVPEPISDLVSQVMNGAPELAPQLSALQYQNVVQGLAATASADLVGPSKNVLLYIRPNTLRYTTNGYAICTRRADLQRVLHEFAEFYRKLLSEYQQQGQFPINGPLEIRASSLDSAAGLRMPGAQPPALSPLAPRAQNPEWDVAVWIGVLTFPGTPHAHQFYRDLESFIFAHYRPPYAMPRVEWSKTWAFSDAGPYTDGDVLTSTIPNSYGDSWGWARSTLASYDPHGVFTNDFLERLFSSTWR
jgi:FAD/FMN-containing dehydrogenase